VIDFTARDKAARPRVTPAPRRFPAVDARPPAHQNVGVSPAAVPGVGPTLPYPVKAAVTRTRSAAWLARTRGRAEDGAGLRILFYHRVSDDPDPLAVTPAAFAAQMAHLARQGYTVLDVPRAASLLDGGEVPPRTIGLSFDDGFRDVVENAGPVLERHGFSATVYLTTGVVDGRASFPWYDRQPPVMSWDEILALDGRGTFGFEAHTITHPNLLLVDDVRAVDEISGSRQELAQRLGRPVTSFCYPAGLYGPRERALVADAGYQTAASCEPGVNDGRTDRLELRRRQIDARDGMLDFRAKLGGGHDTPLPLRTTYRRLRYGMGAGSPRRTSSRV
jgi:peptidoglycan/xylan/chitin deacetylase (PgdA/CDA1 family)